MVLSVKQDGQEGDGVKPAYSGKHCPVAAEAVGVAEMSSQTPSIKSKKHFSK
jgi:hypothetical protein